MFSFFAVRLAWTEPMQRQEFVMNPSHVIAAFEHMALGEGDLPVDGAVAGLAGLMADERMPEEVWLALLTVGLRSTG